MIAENSIQFINKVSEAEMRLLNNTDVGKFVTEKLKSELQRKNPNFTAEEWNQVKSEFMAFLFVKTLENDKKLMDEFSRHIFNEI